MQCAHLRWKKEAFLIAQATATQITNVSKELEVCAKGRTENKPKIQ